MRKYQRSALLAVLTLPAAISIFSASVALTTLTSCEGKAENAGEKIDNAVEKAGDKIENATDKH